MINWISVNRGYPPRHKVVLVFPDDTGTDFAIWNGIHWTFLNILYFCEVTHWAEINMPGEDV